MEKLTKEEAKKIPILDVAHSLGMELKKSSPTEYYWTEHDSLKLNTRKNTWRRYATGDGGDTISLVQYSKDISYRQAMTFLATGEYETTFVPLETVETFTYSLEAYEKPFKEARGYLKNIRGLSDDTIDLFFSKGVLAQATKRAKDDYLEDVLVFKFYDKMNHLVGASLQGITPNQDRHPAKGYLKQTLYASQGTAGLHVDIGNPKRLVFTEAPIDLMSYYELHKDKLSDVRLVSMEGLKDGVVSRYTKELLQDLGLIKQDNLDLSKVKNIEQTAMFLEQTAKMTTFLQDVAPKDFITLAVDNDEAGREFVAKLQDKGIPVNSDLPPLGLGEDKMDWNDLLKQRGGNQMEESYRLKQAKASLEREKARVGEQIEKAIDYQRQTNGQPMNDKRGGASFFKRQRQIDDQISRGLDNIAKKEERVERLEGIKAMNESITLTEGAKELIASNQIKQWQKQPNIYFIKGEQKLALVLSEEGRFIASEGKYSAITAEQAERVKELLAQQEAIDTPNKVTEDISSQETLDKPETVKSDEQIEPMTFEWVKNGKVLYTFGDSKDTDPTEHKKAPELEAQEQEKNAEGTIGDFPEIQGAAPLPEATISQPLNDLSPNQTQPQPLLHFTIKDGGKSIEKRNYHLASPKDIVKLNRYATTIQQTAQWYLREVADSRIIYFYQDKETISSLAVNFDRDKFMHLTGIYPHRLGQTAEQTLLDFANGNGDYESILIANKGATFDKIKVLPELEAIIESDSFYFGDLSGVTKLHQLDLDKAIKSGDEDIILAMRTVDGTTFPASLMKLRQSLKIQLDNTNEERAILGVYRERNGTIEQLSINQEIVKDGGAEMLSILENKQYEVVSEETKQVVEAITAEQFTSVSDAAYNVGVSEELSQDKTLDSDKTTQTQVKEMTDLLDSIVNLGADYFVNERSKFEDNALQERLDTFFERYDLFNGDLVKTVDSFIDDGFVSLDSGFYEDWKQDKEALASPLLESPGDSSHDVEELPEKETIASHEGIKRDVTILEMLDKKDNDALSKHLKEGIKSFRQSDQYKQFLLAMSRFHNYSFRNVQLLMEQNPDATLVASFNKWKKDFNRFVNKGEKSLKVWAPMQVVKRDKNGVPVLNERGEPKLVTLFKLVPVFDVSQTNGQELPKYINQLKGNPEGYDNLYRALRDTSKDKGVSLSFGEDIKKANGYYDPNENKIVIKKGMTKAQTLKTIIHEIAHSDLHNKQAMANNPVTRSEAELQAESVSFVVSAYYGFDTSSYSMPYLNSWLNDKVELSDLKKQLDTVQKEARDLINRVDQCLEKYQSKEVVAELSQDKLAERIASLEREEVSESEAITEEKKYQASQTPSI